MFTCVGQLAFAALAFAEMNSLSGRAEGDPNGTVSMKVVVKHGVPRSSKNIRF